MVLMMKIELTDEELDILQNNLLYLIEDEEIIILYQEMKSTYRI